MNFNDKKKAVQDWLEHTGWEIIRDEINQEIESMTQKLIDTGDEKLRFEVKARQEFLNKIQKYNGWRSETIGSGDSV